MTLRIETLVRHPEVTIFINDRPLVAYVRAVELPFAEALGVPSAAGDYAGIAPSLVLPPAQTWLGERVIDGRHPVLACSCRGCDSGSDTWMTVRITITPDMVIWSDFDCRAAYDKPRRPWNYAGLGPFVFDRAQYTAALQQHALPRPHDQPIAGFLYPDPTYGWAVAISWETAAVPPDERPITLVVGDRDGAATVVTLRRNRWVLDAVRGSHGGALDGWWRVQPWTPAYWRVVLPDDPSAFLTWAATWGNGDIQEIVAGWQDQRVWRRIINPHDTDAGVALHACFDITIHQEIEGQRYRLQVTPEALNQIAMDRQLLQRLFLRDADV